MWPKVTSISGLKSEPKSRSSKYLKQSHKMRNCFFIFAIFFSLGLLGQTKVSGLECYRCGGLASSARTVVDCLSPDQGEVETCGPNEACVTFKRLYKKGSASIRGCYPVSETLPGLSGSKLVPRTECQFQPKRRSPVKVCMCTTDLCNDMEFDIHSERARRLFNRPTTSRSRSRSGSGSDLQGQPSQRTRNPGKGPLFFDAEQDLEAGLEEDFVEDSEHEYEEDDEEMRKGVLDEEAIMEIAKLATARVPRQTGVHDDVRKRRQRQQGLQTDDSIFGQLLTRVPAARFQTRPTPDRTPFDRTRQFPFFGGFDNFRSLPRSSGPVDCKWSDYKEWSKCSRECCGGFQTRQRHIKMLARRGGKPCSGERKETRPCNRHRCARM